MLAISTRDEALSRLTGLLYYTFGTMQSKTKTTAWLNELPKDVKAKLSALCRHHGEDLRKDLAEIVRAYYLAKRMTLATTQQELLDQATANDVARIEGEERLEQTT